uniref:BACK domain-containing protein n=1 Tax=Parascaris univalens TaxID=6257 RepID=A0A914ZDL4_PARUN
MPLTLNTHTGVGEWRPTSSCHRRRESSKYKASRIIKLICAKHPPHITHLNKHVAAYTPPFPYLLHYFPTPQHKRVEHRTTCAERECVKTWTPLPKNVGFLPPLKIYIGCHTGDLDPSRLIYTTLNQKVSLHGIFKQLCARHGVQHSIKAGRRWDRSQTSIDVELR